MTNIFVVIISLGHEVHFLIQHTDKDARGSYNDGKVALQDT